MPAISVSRVVAALSIVLGLYVGGPLAAAQTLAATPMPAATPTPAATAPAAGISASQAHDLVTLLNDPARRNQLIGELQTLEKLAPATPATTPATTPPAAATPAAPAAPTPASVAARAVTRTGLLSQLVLATPHFALGVFGQFAALRHVLSSIPASWHWLKQTATDPEAQQTILHMGLGLAAVLVPALVVWFALRRLLGRRRIRRGALAAPDSSDEAASDEKRPLSARLWSALRWLCLAMLAFVMDAAPVAASAAVGYLLTPALAAPGAPQLLVLGVVESMALFGAVLCVARVLFAPHIPGLRLIPMQDATAASVVRWIAWLEGIAVFGMTILNLALLLGLDPAAQIALKKLVLLIDHLLLVVLVLGNRRAIAAHLRSPKRRSGVFASVLTGLAEVWHIVAVVLIIGLWLIWAADWQGGYTRLLEFVATAVAVGIAARLLTEGILIVLRHVLHVADNTAEGPAPRAVAPRAPPRAARDYPVLSAGIAVTMAIIGLIVLLELCGISSVGWLLGNPLGWQVFSAFVSIVVTLCLAVVAWEAVNIGMDRHLNRLSRQAQMARVTRLRTLLPILRTAVAVAILILVFLTVLSQIGINIAPLLAGAGIVGVAIGFGSQKLVQDLITGLFLLLEDAMQVGDWVTLAGVSGSVEQLSIRTIRLRGGDGSLYIIPFSSVSMVNNTNRGLGNASVSVAVAAREDPDEVGDVLKAIVAEMREDPKFKPMILSDLQYWGVDKVDGASMVLAGQIICTDSGRWGVQREFNRRYKKRFGELGIEIPNPTQTLLLRHGTAARPPVAARPERAGQTTATVAASPPSG
jgi:small-conductance mechanosensitive channel